LADGGYRDAAVAPQNKLELEIPAPFCAVVSAPLFRRLTHDAKKSPLSTCCSYSRGGRFLLRVIPKFAEQTDFQIVDMTAGENQRGRPNPRLARILSRSG